MGAVQVQPADGMGTASAALGSRGAAAPGAPPALDRRSYVPLYVQLHDLLATGLRAGEPPPGAPFPSERELVERYGVSSITARRVLAELAREGYVERRNGVGTFVRAQAPPPRLALLILEFKEAPQPGHRMIASAFGELVGGTAQAAWEAGADLSLAYIHRPEVLAAWLDRARAERTVDGLLVRAAGDVTPDELLLLDRSGLPYVLVKRHVPGRATPCVVADERLAVRLATEHLLALGHRRIGFVASQQSAVLYAERLQGFRDALAGAGLAPAGRLLAPAPDFSAESGRTSAAALLRGPARSRPTALMVASDSMAIGAYEAAAARGLAIPAELSIASVDDIPEARALRPALTTARTSHLEFGLRATRRVLAAVAARWRGDPVPAGAEVIVPELIVRSSTAPPPATRAAPGAAARTGSKETGRRRTP